MLLKNPQTKLMEIFFIMNPVKKAIIEKFNECVRDKDINLENLTSGHDGKRGHWLETQMGVKHNGKNEPDINGYEMKTGCRAVTFIDKSPSFMYLNGDVLSKRCKKDKQLFWDKYACCKDTDIPTVGGWSVNKFNKCGQKIIVDENNNILVIYNYNEDTRKDKDEKNMDKSIHVIMKWDANDLKKSIENKFNQKGFFKCIEEKNKFTKICFGKQITFDFWISEFKNGCIYHDGYSKVGGRGRHVFRASKKFWDNLITEEY